MLVLFINFIFLLKKKKWKKKGGDGGYHHTYKSRGSPFEEHASSPQCRAAAQEGGEPGISQACDVERSILVLWDEPVALVTARALNAVVQSPLGWQRPPHWL